MFFSAFSYSRSVCNLFHNVGYHEHYTIYMWKYIYPPQFIKIYVRGNFCQSVQEINYSQISEIYVFNAGFYGTLFIILFGTDFNKSRKPNSYFKNPTIIDFCMFLVNVCFMEKFFPLNLHLRRCQLKSKLNFFLKLVFCLRNEHN